MGKWYHFPIQTTQNVDIKMPRRLIFHGLGSAWERSLPREETQPTTHVRLAGQLEGVVRGCLLLLLLLLLLLPSPEEEEEEPTPYA